jgi:hypothetical protein
MGEQSAPLINRTHAVAQCAAGDPLVIRPSAGKNARYPLLITGSDPQLARVNLRQLRVKIPPQPGELTVHNAVNKRAGGRARG